MSSDPFQKSILPLKDKLFRLALSITGNREDAEDVVQDVLMNIWNRKDTWEQVDNWEAYCLRSARNTALNKQELRTNKQTSIPDNYDLAESGSNAQDLMEEREQLQMIEQLLRQLPEKQRTVFQLREVEEMTYKAIAEVMDITEEQVKINLFRSRQKIKELINKYMNE